MKKLAVLFMMLLLVGCNMTTQVHNSAHVKVNDVLLAFEREGLTLEETARLKNDDYAQKLNGKLPRAYLLDDKYVYIYEFDSVEDVAKAKEQFRKKTEMINLVSAKMYEHRNVFIQYVHEQSLEEPIKYDEKIEKALASIIEG